MAKRKKPSADTFDFDAPGEAGGSSGNGSGEWIEVSQQLSPDAISKILSSSAGDQLYRLVDGTASLTDLFYPILTTDKTGVFILVNK